MIVQHLPRAGMAFAAAGGHAQVDSAVIYGQLEAKGIAFEGVADALSVPGADLRLFGKPESFARRRMGVALATADDIDTARARAVLAASKVKPVAK